MANRLRCVTSVISIITSVPIPAAVQLLNGDKNIIVRRLHHIQSMYSASLSRASPSSDNIETLSNSDEIENYHT